MKVLKPEWVTHGGASLYSCDIQPDGKRFATAGGDNKVKIWNLGPILDETQEKNNSIPKLLCVLDNHVSPVNCVRWSPNGKYLASGSDDKVIMIWELASTGGNHTVFGSKEKIVETWRCVAQLRGHIADVVDLTWSPQSDKLASASLDNNIIVWDIAKKAKLTELVGHQGWVKGIAWDPIGRYIASQSDDKSVIIWRTTDWGIETVIKQQFAKQLPSSFFSRIAWSPDGGCLTCCHGVNLKNKPTSIVLRRSDWKTQCEFVGHNLPVTSSRFSSSFYRNEDGSPYYICAIGSQDQSVSVWKASANRPLFVVKQVFSQSITDISWSKNGFVLIMCSSDGTFAASILKAGEIGEIIPDNEVTGMFKTWYGEYAVGGGVTKMNIAETPFQLDIEKETAQKQETPAPVQPVQPAPVSPSTNGNNDTPQVIRQKETRLVDGRRRITPMTVQSSSNEIQNTASNPVISESSTSVPLSPASVSQPAKIQTTKSTEEHSAPAVEPMNIDTKNSSKTPAVTTDSSTKSATATTTTLTATTTTTTASKEKENSTTDSTPSKEKRKADSVDTESTKRAKTKETSKKDKTKDKSSKKKKDIASPTKETTSSDSTATTTTAAGGVGISRVSVSVVSSVPTTSAGTSSGKLLVQVSAGGFGEPPTTVEAFESTVTCSHGKIMWEDRLKRTVTHVCGNSKFIAVACEGGLLYTYSPHGRYLLPCIVLGESIISLECNNNSHLMAITQGGQVHLWNILLETNIFSTSMLGLLSSEPDLKIKKAKVSDENGYPILMLSSNQSFTFHLGLKSWLLLSDDRFTDSDFKSSLSQFQRPNEAVPKGPLANAQALSLVSSLRLAPGQISSSLAKKATETIYHLEHQIACSIALNSKNEYKHWMSTYVRKLTEDANELKLQELFFTLLGPAIKTSEIQSSPQPTNSKGWNPTIMGFSKRKMLEEYIAVVGTNRALQRLANQFRESLDILS